MLNAQGSWGRIVFGILFGLPGHAKRYRKRSQSDLERQSAFDFVY